MVMMVTKGERCVFFPKRFSLIISEIVFDHNKIWFRGRSDTDKSNLVSSNEDIISYLVTEPGTGFFSVLNFLF